MTNLGLSISHKSIQSIYLGLYIFAIHSCFGMDTTACDDKSGESCDHAFPFWPLGSVIPFWREGNQKDKHGGHIPKSVFESRKGPGVLDSFVALEDHFTVSKSQTPQCTSIETAVPCFCQSHLGQSANTPASPPPH